MIRRFWAVFVARNLEFIRDRGSLGWYIIFPVVLVFGMGYIFSDEDQAQYKVGLLQAETNLSEAELEFFDTRYVDFIPAGEIDDAMVKISRHQLDMLLDVNENTVRYWINSSSPNGYILEQILQGKTGDYELVRGTVEGKEIPYVDWLVPGVLGMNMMFNCLFGVGFVIVLYRKKGFLKRLNATPLNAMEFIGAQIVSRLVLVMFITTVVFVGTDMLYDFYFVGNYFDLFVITVLGAVSMIAMGLAVASRTSSQELAGGLLNLFSWPMMIVSGVWFSLEGTPKPVQWISQAFPLTHMLEGARAIMFDGKGLVDIGYSIIALLIMTGVFMTISAALFKWKPD
ncbi:MAG: ABC transporter permease [Gammaproteobacteria bacterium]|nr:ABC transporter permease [Gammaproteobacteria bacterium]